MELFLEIIKGVVSIFMYTWWLFALILAYFAWQNHRKASWVTKQESVVLEIKIPKTNDKDPTAAEMMFATLHGILKTKQQLVKEGSLQEHISFEFVADKTSIRFYVWTLKRLKDFVEGQIYAQYPSAEISVTDDYSEKIKKEGLFDNRHISTAELKLVKPDYLPIKTFTNFTVDPLAGITGVLSKVEDEGEEIWIQILSRPVSDEWKTSGLNWVSAKKGQRTSGGSFLSTIAEEPFRFATDLIKAAFIGPIEADGGKGKSIAVEDESRISAVEGKSEKLAFETKIRVVYIAKTNEKASEKMQSVFGAFKQFNTTNLNGFKGIVVRNENNFLGEYQRRLFIGHGFHLNIEELASIYHLPHTSVETPNISWTSSKKGESPTDLPTVDNTATEDLTTFAVTNFRNHNTVFGIKRDDRRRHTYIIGKSGMGKSKLLELMIDSDIKRGEGVAVIDPHGEVITEVLTRIPKDRIDDVIVFDPADTKNPIGFNPMEVIDADLKVQIASGVLGTFKKIFGDSWGPRLEYIFNYTLLALLDTPDTTLMGVVRMLTDKNYRKKIIDNVQDPVVKKFWITEYASYSEKFATEAIAPILNKVGQFVANSLIRNIIGQPKSSFNIRKAMDEGKILLFNLSVGRVGEINASLLGSFIITSIQLAAMSRADTLEEERRDFYLYVDEFQNFATESFATILSEARKYRLDLIMANQYVAQMEDVVREAVFGNVGTMITFRVGAADAGFLEKEFNPPFEAQDLINLARQQIYIRMTIDGQAGQAFSAKTLDVTRGSLSLVDEILLRSRQKYSRPLDEVSKEISNYAGISDNISFKALEEEHLEQSQKTKSQKPGKNKKSADLKSIIAENTAHIVPDSIKPVLKEAREPEVKVKDKIDKEILSEILKNVVRPTDDTKKDNKEVIKTEGNIKEENRGVEKLKSEERHDDVNATKVEVQTSPTFGKHEKVITPDNFKKIKTIHPHETVRVMADTKSHDIKENEEINF